MLCNVATSYVYSTAAWQSVDQIHYNMIMSLMGTREKNDCGGKGQQQITAVITVVIMHSY
jgi:hypothetical protein